MENMLDDYCIAKLDFSNTVNSLHRDSMLKIVLERMREIYKFCHLTYDRPSILSYNSHTDFSSEGPQQGDPLGTSLFCATIHPVLSSLSNILMLGYMDDATVGGKEAQVAGNIETIRTRVARSGLISTARSASSFAKMGVRAIQFSSSFPVLRSCGKH
jgi:hypothetical protein